MSALAAATIVAKRHLALARVISHSFRQHHPGVPFFVLLADEPDDLLNPSTEDFELLTLDTLGKEDLLPWCLRYEQLPLSYALTPVLLQHLLGRFQRVIFIKQESLVLGRLDSLLQALEQASLVLTPHLLEPLRGENHLHRELAILQAGTYNGGILGLRDCRSAHDFLAWWRQRVELSCRHDVAAGLHYEQRWLDLAPWLFEDVQVLRDPGCNVGHWHLPERQVFWSDTQPLVDGVPCSLFRFSGFEGAAQNQVTRYVNRLTLDQLGDAGQVFLHYREQLLAAGHERCRQWPYAWERFANGVVIPPIVRELYLGLGKDIVQFGNPFACGTNSFFAWLRQPQRADRPALTRLWFALYLRREDVMAAYPDPFGADHAGLLGWIRNTGWREFALDRVWLPEPEA